MALSKTAAIKLSRKEISNPISQGHNSWVVIGPRKVTDLNGPRTEARATSYREALSIARGWAAEIAISIMGMHDDETSLIITHFADEFNNLNHLVNYVLSKQIPE